MRQPNDPAPDSTNAPARAPTVAPENNKGKAPGKDPAASAQPVALDHESVAGEEDPGASLDMPVGKPP